MLIFFSHAVGGRDKLPFCKGGVNSIYFASNAKDASRRFQFKEIVSHLSLIVFGNFFLRCVLNRDEHCLPMVIFLDDPYFMPRNVGSNLSQTVIPVLKRDRLARSTFAILITFARSDLQNTCLCNSDQ